ncbi:flagellar hook-basal body complex protein [Bacillus methanolicus PB1]|uniref:Flagellar hook-basal body complex protein FliE n=1 Tax=Bacillus methanolicus PB1 TaxID=997296 RepID=I3E4T2_BACMT|nr:flagellar hook-basal body complex protein FliE [Bacillus methanolicus]EIJ81503.1 flagellar hook-basal body complex protein [Bacillus methanolicus PB1]
MESISFPLTAHILKPEGKKAPTHTYTPYEAQQKFAAVLKEQIEKINKAQNQSDLMTEKLARGENVDLHQVMIASQKASITLQATIEIRNKVIEAYQEVMRMQV